jgi:hypothetical protein
MFYSAESIADDSPICPRHKRKPRKARTVTRRDLAITALRAEHSARVAQWYPDGEPYACLITDLAHDERALAEWPDGAPFGWMVHATGTHIIRAGTDHRDTWRCLTCGRDGRLWGQGRDLPPPAVCPGCTSERSSDHGPQIVCTYGAMVASAFRGTPIRFYAWDGSALTELPDAVAFDERITVLGSYEVRS